jgi:hypothetical protein
MKGRGKTIALLTVAVGLAVLVAAGIVAKNRIMEEWWIRKLEMGDETERILAAKRLGELRSIKAVALPLALFGESCPRNEFLSIVKSDNGAPMLLVIEESKRAPLSLSTPIAGADKTVLSFVCIDSVVKIARDAPRGVESALIEALGNDSRRDVRECCCNLLGLRQATSEETGLALRKSLQDNDFVVSEAAAQALKRIQRKQDEAQR